MQTPQSPSYNFYDDFKHSLAMSLHPFACDGLKMHYKCRNIDLLTIKSIGISDLALLNVGRAILLSVLVKF